MADEMPKAPMKDKEEGPKKKKAQKGVRLFPANKKGLHKMPLMDVLRFLFYPIHALVYPFKLYGNKKIGKDSFIYMGNHYCLWDIFYPAHTTREGIHFLAKESILHAPVVGGWAKRVGVIGAMRDGSDVRTLMDAMRVLKNGEKISIFPEGTRNKKPGDEFLPFHGGVALIAIKTKTPIIPFVICNRPKPFRRTHVVFGNPVELSEYYDRKLTSEDYAEADSKLQNLLYTMRAEFWEKKNAKKNAKKAKKAEKKEAKVAKSK